MNSIKKIFLVGAAVSAIFATSASAVPILVAYNPANPTLQVQPSNNGDDTLATWGASMIAAYNALYNPDLPALPVQTYKLNPGDANPIGSVFGGSTTSISLNVTGINYLLLSWGGGNGIGTGGNGTLETLYYINGYVGNWTFTNSPANGGLSSLHVYGSTPNNNTGVPDGGSTALMFGLGLAAMAWVVRRLA